MKRALGKAKVTRKKIENTLRWMRVYLRSEVRIYRRQNSIDSSGFEDFAELLLRSQIVSRQNMIESLTVFRRDPITDEESDCRA